MTDQNAWGAEFYEDDAGRRPVELWMDSLTLAEYAAVRAAIIRVLEVRGMKLGSTPWLKPLGDGLFEFRVRHDAATIEALYSPTAHAQGSAPPPTQSKILLRLFVHFYGNKVILLLHGYDKGGNDSPRQQNKENPGSPQAFDALEGSRGQAFQGAAQEAVGRCAYVVFDIRCGCSIDERSGDGKDLCRVRARA